MEYNIRKCNYCNKELPHRKPSRNFKLVFCNREHQNLFYKENSHLYSGKKSKKYKERINKKCLKCGKEFKVSQYREKTSKFCSRSCVARYYNSVVKYGKDNPAWKGGISPINERIRQSKEYKLWRESVFKRDNYSCIWCGKTGGILNADHIKPFALYPELRFAIDNGRTLCIDCHKITDTYGYTKDYRN